MEYGVADFNGRPKAIDVIVTSAPVRARPPALARKKGNAFALSRFLSLSKRARASSRCVRSACAHQAVNEHGVPTEDAAIAFESSSPRREQVSLSLSLSLARGRCVASLSEGESAWCVQVRPGEAVPRARAVVRGGQEYGLH